MSMMKAVAALMASLMEWQSQSASLPNMAGSTQVRTGGQMRLRDSDTMRALPVWRVLCQ